MKTMSCTETQHWLAHNEPLPSTDIAEALQNHLDECPQCSVLHNTVRETTAAFQKNTTNTAQWAPSFHTVRDAALAQAARPGAFAGWWKWAPVAVCTALVAIWFYPEPPPTEPPGFLIQAELRVQNVRGLANLRGGSAGLAPLTKDARLVVGAVIVTGPDSQLVANEPNIASWSLAAESALNIVAWSQEHVALALDTGEVRLDVEKRQAGQRFEVNTEYCSVSVVGTAFVVTHVPGVHTQVSVVSGIVKVEPNGQPPVLLYKGDTFTVPAPNLRIVTTHEPDPVELLAEEPNEPTTEPPVENPTQAVVRREFDVDDGTVRHAHRGLERVKIRAATVPEPEPREVVLPTPLPTPSPKSETTEAETLQQGRALLAKGADAEAIQLLQQAITQGQKTPRVLALLADGYRVSGDVDQARKTYNQALTASEPEPTPQLLADLATLVQQHGDPEEAARVWERYLEAAPKGPRAPEALAMLADVAERQGNEDQAKTIHQQLCDQHPSTLECRRTLVDVGKKLLGAKKWDQAAQHFETHAQSPQPKLAEAAMVGLIRAKIGAGQIEEARQWLQTLDHRFPTTTRKEEIDAIRKSLERP